jgi:hypothetical protein
MTKGVDELTKKMKSLSTSMNRTLKNLDEEIRKTQIKIRQGQIKKRPGVSVRKHKHHLANLLQQKTSFMRKKKNLSSSVASMNNIISKMKSLKH